MDTLILNKGSQKLKFYFFYDVLLPSAYSYYHRQLPKSDIENELQWKKAVGFYDPFENIHAPGPLFSNFDKKFSLKTRLYAHTQNFEGLLPDIADYVAQEYQQKRIVFFHGQNTIWMLLEKIYRRVYELAFHQKISENFIPLRFKLHSSLVEEDLERIKTQLMPYRNAPYSDSLFFASLHLDAGDGGQNTINYITLNHSQKTNNINKDDFSFADSFISDMFKEFGLENLYQQLSESYPTGFTDLKKTFDEAIADQGYYGRLLVISMPRQLAQKLSYSADWDGDTRFFRIFSENEGSLRTCDTTVLADHYDHMPERNEFVLMLAEDLINPEAAKHADVKIVSFDPAFYWQTEKAMNFEKELEGFFNIIQKLHFCINL